MIGGWTEDDKEQTYIKQGTENYGYMCDQVLIQSGLGHGVHPTTRNFTCGFTSIEEASNASGNVNHKSEKIHDENLIRQVDKHGQSIVE